jgi:hypothetical protein
MSANPFETFKIYNVADVSSATNVSSANNGLKEVMEIWRHLLLKEILRESNS